MTTMRVRIKTAAASAAAAFLLLLVFDLTWPGHGVWLLVVGILVGLAAAYLWWREHFQPDQRGQSSTSSSPFSDAGAYGLSGAVLASSRQQPPGVSLTTVTAPISALAILLFIGGALGSGEGKVEEAVTNLDQRVTVIDRSRDGESATSRVDPPSADQAQLTPTTTRVATVSPPQNPNVRAESSSSVQQSVAPVKPIVVAAPKAASPAGAETDEVNLAPESANTFEYVVAEGDTLYDIAERYNSTVDIIMNLNRLDASSFIHPGDVLLIPLQDEDSEVEES